MRKFRRESEQKKQVRLPQLSIDDEIVCRNCLLMIYESNFFTRLTAESWFILSRLIVINRSDGESFPVVYRCLL